VNTKQVIVLRKDLNMRKGKMVAQGAHASMKAILDLGRVVNRYTFDGERAETDYVVPLFRRELEFDYAEVLDWLEGLFTKICVGVNGETELLNIYEHAKEKNLVCSLIQDAGLTEFDGVPTYTAVAVGPGRAEDVDEITGHLKLL